MKLRIALVVSHPVQHFCPQYVSFAANNNIVFKVFFGSMLGYRKYIDPDFGQEIVWGNLELGKFDHEFLNGEKTLPADKKLDAPLLDKALAYFKPDVVICYGYFQLLQRRAHRWARHNKVPIAYISDSERRQQRHAVKELIKYPWMRWYFSGIHYFLTVGNANEDFYRYYGAPDKRFIRMHFPIDIKQYREEFANYQSGRQQIRQKHQIKAEDIVLSVVGKLVAWKNQDHLISALKLLEDKNIILQLLIIGSGEMQQAWEKKASILKKSKVHFTGFISIDQLPSYYAATDIYVHPASIEPHSIAVSEAVYMGCPVIVTSASGSYGFSDDVQEGKNGFVYPCGDINVLCDYIEKLVSDETLRSSFTTCSHRLGMKFQHQAHVGIVDDLIKRLSKNSTTNPGNRI